MILGFADKDTRELWERRKSPKFGDFQKTALRKLSVLNAAKTIQDLRAPPGNHLERLRGDRDGQHSIRVNDQWRVCFRWSDAGPGEVEIADYH